MILNSQYMSRDNKRDGFSGSFGMIAATIGSAVGLGNLWRFPYLVGQNGGAAFILIYLFFSIVICTPIMVAELVIGRRGQGAPAISFFNLSGSRKWASVGILAMFTCILILSFYGVVGGWTIKYLVNSVCLQYREGAVLDSASAFGQFVSGSGGPIVYFLIFTALTGAVILAGVTKGIERTSKFMMPVLFVLVVLVAVRSITLPGSAEGLKYLFKPDFSQIDSNVVLAALGQAFFSLSLGAGMQITYGSYTRSDDNIIQNAFISSFSDTLFAILAGCAIMPAVFAFGINPGEGAGLAFVTLPQVFVQMPMGGLFAILFFATLFLAAITSAISLFEVVTASMMEIWKMTRRKAALLTGSIIVALGCVCSLSQGVLSGFTVFGKNVFDLFDYVSSNVLMLLTSLLVVLFVGWRLKKEAFLDEVTAGGRARMPRSVGAVLFYIIKYAAPLVIFAIVLSVIIK